LIGVELLLYREHKLFHECGGLECGSVWWLHGWMKAIWAGLALALLCGCSTFNKEWKAATQNPPGKGIDGAWAGEWRSQKNNHNGSLRCVVSQTSPDTYRAHFRAKFFKIFRYTYVATLHGSESNGVVNLAGEADLGKMAGGVYKYKGTATSEEFRSTYESKYDHGHYEMKRPAK
jgi:hypothetical protein